VPVFPLHLWLPEAHVEAPTFGSIILASVLLKLGGYAIIRFLLPVFPSATLYFRPLVLVLCLTGALYAACVAIVQVDIKKIVAYSSVSHMNFAVLSIFTLTPEGIMGGLILLLAHGFTSAALFYLVGIFYRRFHTRLLKYYSGLVLIMPFFAVFFFIFLLTNIGFPGTLNFVGELLIFFSVLNSSYGLYVLFFTFFIFFATIGYNI